MSTQIKAWWSGRGSKCHSNSQRFRLGVGQCLQAWALLMLAGWGLPTPVQAQALRRGAEAAKATSITLTTKDDLSLRAEYYASPVGKEAVTILLLHDFAGSSKDFEPFVLALQEKKYAVLSVTLRGHGELAGSSGLSPEKLKARDFANMVLDVEAAKKFLIDENNKEKLNIENLGVVAAGMSCPVAVNWAALDWSWPQLPGRKQGQDVKALTLISPSLSYEGFSAANAFKDPNIAQVLGIQFVYGLQSPQAKDMKKLTKQMEAARGIRNSKPKKRKKDEPETPPAVRTDFQVVALDTDAQGIDLLLAPAFKSKVPPAVLAFLKDNLEDKKSPWQKRE